MQERWESIISGTRGGPGPALARWGLALASGAYWLGLQANLHIYETGLKRRTTPALPVISIGNLTLGGSGKTTASAFVAGLIQERAKPAIVLRGYRSQATGVVVVSDGESALAGLSEAGDEALMLSRCVPGCAVAVGKRRERVIDVLRAQTDAQVVILDDGFQYFRMARRLDIVLLDALASERTWRLFPAGRLREPPAHLRRADQVWITHADLAPPDRVDALRKLGHRHCPEGIVATARHALGPLRPLEPGGDAPKTPAGRRVLAVSALGNPRAFELGLADLGARVESLRFADHHRYRAGDYDLIVSRAEEVGAEIIVTTEKDAVKLPSPPARCPPIAVLACHLEIIEGLDELTADLHSICAEAAGHDGKGDGA